MAQEKDLYGILGVAKNAGDDEIKTAYKKLVRMYHPDLNPNDKASEDKFKEVAVAFEVLGDKKKRQLYDDFGMAGIRPGFDEQQARAYQQFGGGNPFGGGGGFGGGGFGGGGGDLGSIFEQFFGGGGGAQQQPRPQGPAKGKDIEKRVHLDLLDAMLGTKTEVELKKPTRCDPCRGTGSRSKRPSTCPACRGRGRVQHQSGMFATTRICQECGGTGEAITDPCKECRGAGVQTTQSSLTVTIPPGITDGSRIRLSRQGAAGKRGGPPGDLYLIPKIRPHDFFVRGTTNTRNLELEVPLTAHEAFSGASIDVPTPTGTVGLRIPPRAQSGQKMRLRGKGAAAHKKQEAGDLIVTLKVLLPTEENPEAAALLEQLDAFYAGPLRDHFGGDVEQAEQAE